MIVERKATGTAQTRRPGMLHFDGEIAERIRFEVETVAEVLHEFRSE